MGSTLQFGGAVKETPNLASLYRKGSAESDRRTETSSANTGPASSFTT
jgi:hypothetical protein